MRRQLRLSAFALAGIVAASCASAPPQSRAVYTPGAMPEEDAPIAVQKVGRPYQVFGRWYTPTRQDDYEAVGEASWYGADFHGRPTANGEIFDMNRLTAAHPTLPIPSYIQVTNLDNGRTAVLRLNDRGPFARNRILDVSRRAADELGFLNRGTANVRVVYLGPRESELGGGRLYTAAAETAPATVPASAPAPAPVPAPSGTIEVASITRVDPAPAPASAPAETAPAGIQAAPIQVASIGAPTPLGPAAPAPTPTREVSIASSGWFIQAGAFSDGPRAEAVRTRLDGIGPVNIETVSVAGQTLHRVLVGPYPAELAASAARYEVADAGFREARLVLRN